jgi:hypothetical protein
VNLRSNGKRDGDSFETPRASAGASIPQATDEVIGIPDQEPESGVVESLDNINAEKEQVVRQGLEWAGFTVNPTKIDRLPIMIASRHDWGRLGFLVRGRERRMGDHETSVDITKPGRASAEERLLEFERVCRDNSLTPWIAVYVRASGDLYATSVANFRAKYRADVQKIPTWHMHREAKTRYSQDKDVMHVNVRGSNDYAIRWFGSAEPLGGSAKPRLQA